MGHGTTSWDTEIPHAGSQDLLMRLTNQHSSVLLQLIEQFLIGPELIFNFLIKQGKLRLKVRDFFVVLIVLATDRLA